MCILVVHRVDDFPPAGALVSVKLSQLQAGVVC